MIRDERIPSDELRRIDEEIRSDWHTGEDVDFEDAIAYHESLPDHKRFADVLESADKPFSSREPGCPGSTTRSNSFDTSSRRARRISSRRLSTRTRVTMSTRRPSRASTRPLETGDDTLNGFPAANHGVDGCRELIDAVDAPIEVRHGTPDARLLAAITFAGGFQSFEGGPISYNIPYTKRHGLEETIEKWQFVDRLAGAYTERGVRINREPFGPLTGTLVPPSIAIAIMIVEGKLAATQGVRSITLGYGQVGNIVQDVAALHALKKLGNEYLPDEVVVTTVFHEWMGGFPPDEARANGVISFGGMTAAIAQPDKVITKSPQEFQGVPTMEANSAGLRTTRQVIDMAIEQQIDIDGIEEEQDLIERETRCLMDSIFEHGDGDVVQGTLKAFDSGALDVPFAPSDSAAGAVLPARDDDGRVRIFEWADLEMDEDIKEIHRARLSQRADTEGREQSFRMVADDVDAISDGKLIGRPQGDASP